jgi:hypothetical protein
MKKIMVYAFQLIIQTRSCRASHRRRSIPISTNDCISDYYSSIHGIYSLLNHMIATVLGPEPACRLPYEFTSYSSTQPNPYNGRTSRTRRYQTWEHPKPGLPSRANLLHTAKRKISVPNNLFWQHTKTYNFVLVRFTLFSLFRKRDLVSRGSVSLTCDNRQAVDLPKYWHH